MAEAKLTNSSTPWDLGGQGKIHDDKAVLQDALRATPLVFLTVMAQNATGKLIPLINTVPATVDSIPAGLLMSDDITAAALVAGDVTGQSLLIGSDKMIDEDLIVLENALTLATIVTNTGFTIRQHLEHIGIYPRKSTNNQQIQPIA